jgi:hypothetical protein
MHVSSAYVRYGRDTGLYAGTTGCILAREDVFRGLVSKGNSREGILYECTSIVT